jgi:phospholipid N-methyltransferase
MSDEKMKKQMEFIVEHQAKFAAELEMLREQQSIMREQQASDTKRLSDAVLSVVDSVGGLARAVLAVENRLESLTTIVERLSNAQARTEERLNIFINVVERYINGNGRSESSA